MTNENCSNFMYSSSSFPPPVLLILHVVYHGFHQPSLSKQFFWSFQWHGSESDHAWSHTYLWSTAPKLLLLFRSHWSSEFRVSIVMLMVYTFSDGVGTIVSVYKVNWAILGTSYDESRFPLCPKSDKFLAPIGSTCKTVYSSCAAQRYHNTTLVTISASGQIIPHMHIFPGQQFAYNPLEGGDYFGCSSNGWIETGLFYDCIKSIFPFVWILWIFEN